MDINDFKFKLEFSIEEMNMVFKFLETIPYGQVAGLYDNVKKQVDKQLLPMDSFDTPEEQIKAQNGLKADTDFPV